VDKVSDEKGINDERGEDGGSQSTLIGQMLEGATPHPTAETVSSLRDHDKSWDVDDTQVAAKFNFNQTDLFDHSM
jgi:hypothetical protein